VLNEKVIENPVIENQEVYRLWYDYLRANRDYEELCSYIQEFKTLGEKAFLPLGDWQHSKVVGFAKVYSYWGDIFINSWEDTFTEINRRIEQQVGKDNDPSRKIVEQDKLSSLREFTSLEEAYITIPQNYFSLSIPYGVPIDKLMEQLREIVLRKIEGRQPDKRPLFPLPSRKLFECDIKNLRRYLEVYRLKEIARLSWGEVIQQVDPRDEINKCLDPKVWRRERDSARDIIENVGRNIFPGEYGQVKERKKRTTKKKVR